MEYNEILHEHILSLFQENELKIEIKLIRNESGKIDHEGSVGIKAIHLPSGIEEICETYKSQIQNANIALLALKKSIDYYYKK
jgi:protein subunit release factor A